MCSGCFRKKNKSMDSFASSGGVTGAAMRSSAGAVSARDLARDSLTSNPRPTPLDETYDWDILYEETSIENVQEVDDTRQSVLSVLWPQLKIGMDLTKITLPTYILERRSLLEMYADFFAHPDMFVAIADGATPKDRMIAVTRWYLASFHAGRKSDVAKKPYNPLLGEVFSCWWSSVDPKITPTTPPPPPPPATPSPSPHPSTISTAHNIHAHDVHGPQSSDTKSTRNSIFVDPATKYSQFNEKSIHAGNQGLFSKDGKFLPWCYGLNNLIFCGEQVSHHPPISAFYAEHPGKKISVNAHIWTKSKFLGLSVGVQNIGEGVVTVQTVQGTKEEYVFGFPAGYARSILSVPWVELGGDVKINCEQTGWSATIEFCTKTLFGKDRNRVIAKIYNPSDKKPFMVIDGLWNDVMLVKVPEGSKEKIDVKALRIWRKETRRVVEQEPFESRRIWKDVTRYLKFSDTDSAAACKKYLEDRQRTEAKARDETKSAWRPRMFEKSGDNWVFIHPLEKRWSIDVDHP